MAPLKSAGVGPAASGTGGDTAAPRALRGQHSYCQSCGAPVTWVMDGCHYAVPVQARPDTEVRRSLTDTGRIGRSNRGGVASQLVWVPANDGAWVDHRDVCDRAIEGTTYSIDGRYPKGVAVG